MNKPTIIGIIIAAALVFLLFKIVTGAYTLLTGTLNTVLGVALVIALVLIVIWMFRYANRKR